MHREISLLRAANGAAKVGAGLIRQQRLQLLEDEVARQEKRAKKRNKEAKAAIELANPAMDALVEQYLRQAGIDAAVVA